MKPKLIKDLPPTGWTKPARARHISMGIKDFWKKRERK